MSTEALAALLGNMSDSQFRQTYSQISAAAAGGGAYAAPTPQSAQSKTYMKNLQSWSTSSTPNSRSARARNSTSAAARPTAPTPTSFTPNPLMQIYQQQSALPIQTGPLPTTKQALVSTYSSRLRTGCTLLMQPILKSSDTTATATVRNSRRGTAINYADPGSGDELPDAGALDSDDSDFVDSDGGGPPPPPPRRGSAKPQASTSSAPASSLPAFLSNELDKSYLGQVPPARFVKPRPFYPIVHPYPSTQDEIDRHAARRTALVPVRVEFETDTHRIRDCFMWNINENVITPETFAQTFCNDLDIPVHMWAETVANQIRAQLEEHEGVASLDIGMDGVADDGSSLKEGDELLECRVMLSIDVQINNHHLIDFIEWDLLSPLTPEAFAKQLCSDIGLSGEAIPLVAHAVHEELIKHKRDAVEWGVIGLDRDDEDGGRRDRNLKDKTGLGLHWGRAPKDGRGPKALKSVWRDWQESEEFKTRFEELTAEEVERREFEQVRATRRLRRETFKFQTSARSRRR